MTSLVVPLWALSLGASPSMIGIAVASRSVLPFFLSIHGGAMMDRLGTRRLMLLFTGGGAVLSLLYPLLPWMGAVVALQLITGWAQGMGWIGAQTKIARLMRGNAVYAARFSLATTFGMFLGPLITGIAWDFLGAWGAFLFIAVWGGCLFAATVALPLPPAARAKQSLSWRDFVPNLNDYVQAFALMAIPAVALVVTATFLRISAFSVQGSFYTVYLQGIGLPGTLIGILVGFAALIGGPAGLLVGPLLKRMRPHWLLLSAIGLAIVFICITPLLSGFIPLLIAAALFGAGVGVSLPLLLSILSEATDVRAQGVSVGLRTTANRLASIVIPVSMGLLVEFSGIESGFLLVGVILFVMLAGIALIVRRSPAFSQPARD